MKNRTGFTLIEMMVTIGIIIILSTVLTTSVVNYISNAQNASGAVESHQNKYDAAKSSVDDLGGVSGAAASPTTPPVVTYIVTFADWDGTVLKTQSVPSGSAATAPADPIRTGYIFSGWDVSFSNITSTITVTAVYTTTPITAVTISGTAQVGQILTVGVQPSGATAAYQWSSSATSGGPYSDISGATSGLYTLGTGEAAKYMKVTAAGSGSYSGTVTSAASGPVSAMSISGVSISGTAQFGQTLTASVTPSGAAVTYQWSSSTTSSGTYSNISGATGSTYTLVLANLSKYIKVTVIGTGALTGTVTSAPVGPVTRPLSGVTISGTLKKNYTLTANITPTGATAAYQWQIAPASTGAWVDISGATAKTYKLPNNTNYNTKFIRVIATGTGGYINSTVTSGASGPIG